jgi:hypothetical protein
LNVGDEEATAATEEDDIVDRKTHQPKDCAICMLPIDMKHGGHSVLSKTNYMVTPCHHMFHTECLEKVNAINHCNLGDLLLRISFYSG